MNQTGMSEDEKRKCEQYVKSVQEMGGIVRIVRDPASIREDLEENK
jgi:stalled ribosome rescue protein Dom34